MLAKTVGLLLLEDIPVMADMTLGKWIYPPREDTFIGITLIVEKV